jgi:hypothetical protein
MLNMKTIVKLLELLEINRVSNADPAMHTRTSTNNMNYE